MNYILVGCPWFLGLTETIVKNVERIERVCLISFLFERTFGPFLCFSGFTSNDIVRGVRGDRIDYTFSEICITLRR